MKISSIQIPRRPTPGSRARLDTWPSNIRSLSTTRRGKPVAPGPLDARTSRLIHLALAIAAGSEGAAHSHARRALAEGISLEELEHIPVLAITTIGWSQAIKGMTWVRDITRRRL
jgi:alkylhydroperoxidase/carboxymuconolactone decarboxylase family protein YurZ